MEPLITARKTRLVDLDDSFDREFWNRETPSRRVELVWEISERAYELGGKLPDASGRPRSVARLHRP